MRKVVKRRGTETILAAPVPANMLERSVDHVRSLAAVLIGKFCWCVYRCIPIFATPLAPRSAEPASNALS